LIQKTLKKSIRRVNKRGNGRRGPEKGGFNPTSLDFEGGKGGKVLPQGA